MITIIESQLHQHIVVRDHSFDWISKTRNGESLFRERELMERDMGKGIKVYSLIDVSAVPAYIDFALAAKTMIWGLSQLGIELVRILSRQG